MGYLHLDDVNELWHLKWEKAMNELERTQGLYGANEEEANEKFAELRIACENMTANLDHKAGLDGRAFPIWGRVALKAIWPLLTTFVNMLPVDEETKAILKSNLDFIYKRLINKAVEPMSGQIDFEAINKQLQAKDDQIMELANRNVELTNSLLLERKTPETKPKAKPETKQEMETKPETKAETKARQKAERDN